MAEQRDVQALAATVRASLLAAHESTYTPMSTRRMNHIQALAALDSLAAELVSLKDAAARFVSVTDDERDSWPTGDDYKAWLDELVAAREALGAMIGAPPRFAAAREALGRQA